MNSWLTAFAETPKTAEQYLQESVDSLSLSELDKLAAAFDPSSRPTKLDDMAYKIAGATQLGQELAVEHGNALEKQALLGQLLGGVAKNIATSAISGGVSKAMTGATNAAQQGFKYAGLIPPGAGQALSGFAHKAVGYAARNPGSVMAGAGALAGAALAPRDEQGNKQYARGAVMGGLAGAGVNAISGGAAGKALQQGVMKKQWLGQGAANYTVDAARASKLRDSMSRGFVPDGNRDALLNSRHRNWQGPRQQPAPFANAAPYGGGPVMGQAKVASFEELVKQAFGYEKKANRQTLTYDPSTKTFTRQHLTPSGGGEAVAATGAAPIAPGHAEPVRSNVPAYGSRQYFQQRMSEAGVGNFSRNATAPSPAVPTRAPVPTGVNTGAVTGASPMRAAARMGGPAGVGGAMAKPIAKPAMGGLMAGLKKV